MASAVFAVSSASEPVYTPWVYYNHLLKEKQALFFELTAKKNHFYLPPADKKIFGLSLSDRHIIQQHTG